MKKLWLLLGGLCLALLMCEKPSTEEPNQVVDLSVEATEGGKGVVLTWEPADNAETYNVYFNGELLLSEITAAEYIHASPTKTGYYTVSALASDQEGPESDSVSTEPVIQVHIVYELNGEGDQGIAWDVKAESTAVYPMVDETHQDKIDCYFTDWIPGCDGCYEIGDYSLTSGEELWEDNGNTWLDPSGWRQTGISDSLEGVSFDEVGLVPYYSLDSLMYYNYTDVSVGGIYAIWGEDGYYGLIEVQDMDPPIGQLTVRTAFQRIKEFRLFKR